MAERRMFAKTIIDSDAFLDMPMSAQCLYFHLAMRADDDGFLNNPKKVQRMIGCSDDDLKILLAKRFLIRFESGVVVIKHWKIHNYIRNDRYKPTVYKEEKALLQEKSNGAYTLGIPVGIPDDCQDGYQMETQVRLGKDSIGKDRLDNNPPYPPKGEKRAFVPPTLGEIEEYCKARNSTVDPKMFYDYFTAGNWHDSKGNPVKNWKQKLITWEKGDANGRTKSVSNKNPADNREAERDYSYLYDF